MKNPEQKAREAGIQIGLYFLKVYNSDYNATEEYIRKLKITDIRCDDECVTVYTARPGLIIGKKGIHYEALSIIFGKFEIIETFDWGDVITPIDHAMEMQLEAENEAYYSFNRHLYGKKN